MICAICRKSVRMILNAYVDEVPCQVCGECFIDWYQTDKDEDDKPISLDGGVTFNEVRK